MSEYGGKLMTDDHKDIESLIEAKNKISAVLRGLVIYVQQLENGNFTTYSFPIELQ